MDGHKHFSMALSQYLGAIHAFSMFIHYPKYIHRILNAILVLYSECTCNIFWEVCIQKDILVSLQGVFLRREPAFGQKLPRPREKYLSWVGGQALVISLGP